MNKKRRQNEDHNDVESEEASRLSKHKGEQKKTFNDLNEIKAERKLDKENMICSK